MVLFRGREIRHGQSQHGCVFTLAAHAKGKSPASLRTSLALRSGDRLEADLVDGAIVLRTLARARPSDQAASPAASAKLRASYGRERRTYQAWARTAAQACPVRRCGNSFIPKRGPGRPRKVSPPKPAFPANPLAALGPAKLLKKAELEVKPPPENAVASPPMPARRIRPDSSVQPVERRPFRNVEVRPLGPGRGHNRQRRFATRDG